MNTQNKRERLIDSASTLFHQQGLGATSLADIAKHADIPIGNVYYYFKTKEELAMAAVTRRQEQFSAAYKLLEESFADPRERLTEALGFFEKSRDEYAKYGCPVGKLVSDADVEKDAVAKTAAGIFADFVDWAERQFRQLGHSDTARGHAVSLVAGMQGAGILGKAFGNPQVITDEMARLTAWLQTIPNRRIHIGKVAVKPADAAA